MEIQMTLDGNSVVIREHMTGRGAVIDVSIWPAADDRNQFGMGLNIAEATALEAALGAFIRSEKQSEALSVAQRKAEIEARD